MELRCEHCNGGRKGRHIAYREEFKQVLCHNCYDHHKEHPVHPLPALGKIEVDDRGRIICHICGRAYDKLTAHIIQRHKMTKKEYTSKFSLNSGVRLTSETHRNVLREKIKVQENLKDITEINKATRFKKGQVSPRKGKGASLQTCYNLTFPRPRKKKED